MKHVSTHDQVYDIFTKGLTALRFFFFCDKLMVQCLLIKGSYYSYYTHQPKTSKSDNKQDSSFDKSISRYPHDSSILPLQN